jgi:hypothetical protein
MISKNELSRAEKIKNWEDVIALNQLDGEWIPSKVYMDLVEKEINGEITTEEMIKILIEKYTEKS